MVKINNMDLMKVLKLALIVLGILAGIVVCFKLAVFFAPFLIAYLVATLMEPVIRFLSSRFKIRRKLAAAITLLIVLVAFGSVLFLLINKLIAEARELSLHLPVYVSQIYQEIIALINRATDMYNELPEEVISNLEGLKSQLPNKLNIESILGDLSKPLGKIIKGISGIPQGLIIVIVTILSTYFLASDREKIADVFVSQFPESWIVKFRDIKNDMFFAFFGYLKALCILLAITFTELSIGFTIIGVRYTLLLALVISIVDALPILGTGTVLIPWGLYNIVTGDIRMGLSLFILYFIVLIVRQLIEPKIVGEQIGIHPLLTLMAMYTGLNLLGFAGLILGPVTLLLLKNILMGLFKGKSLKSMISHSEE
ncbi:MAG: sporulation integral membrane protein YtvI [Clostridia bacterium]|nr:sporulation integral membrane protein YtvI [Clostridia bacterium]